jgi:hypothetical protein
VKQSRVSLVPWPDFSELSFGFAFLREFERRHASGGTFPSAPDFISQNDEAKKGYDVAVLEGSTPVFFQFKRSYLLTTRRAKEIQAGDFTDPVLYRMHLRQKDSCRQHIALQKLEQNGNRVFYVTSQIDSFEDLTRAYIADAILDQTAALFAPSEIILPDLVAAHHLCFRAADNFAFVYSEEGRRFRRQFPRWELAVERAFLPGRHSTEENRAALAEVASELSRRSRAARELAERFDDPVIRAAVLCFLVLDTQLTFYRQPD